MPCLPVTRVPGREAAAGCGVRAQADETPWRKQRVRVPKRVWSSGQYSPGAVALYAQLAALDARQDRCRAGVGTLAAYLEVSRRTVERQLAELAVAGPDGITELATVRRTAVGGRGQTAVRRVRRPARTEHFAYVPVAAAKTLPAVLFTAYCALAYAQALHAPVTAGEIASLTGAHERSARRWIDRLEALGWVSVERRAGHQGRHLVTVHDSPLRAVPDSTDTDGGSGPDTGGGSLAIKEDAGLTDGRSAQERGSFRRRRDHGSYRGHPVDTGSNTFAVAPPASPEAPYTGPPLSLSPRVWHVLAPVRDLLPAVSPYLMRRIARETGRQLDAGVHPEDIHDQLRTLRAWTPPGTLTDPGRWILGAALPARPGPCGLTDCIRGFMRHTGHPCKSCAEHPGRTA